MSLDLLAQALPLMDTVKIGFPHANFNIRVLPESDNHNKNKKNFSYQFVESFIETPNSVIYLSAFPRKGSDLCDVYLSFSVPKLLQGNNIHLVRGDVENVLEVQRKLADALNPFGIIDFDWWDCGMSRLDAAVNVDVGEGLIPRYIDKLKNINVPDFHRHIHDNGRKRKNRFDNGAEFYNTIEAMRVYGKEEESHDIAAKGKLRIERSILKRDKITKILGLPKKTVGRPINLTREILVSLLADSFHKLELDMDSTFIMDLQDHLMQMDVPYRTIEQLYCYLSIKSKFPSKTTAQLAKLCKTTSPTINKRIRLCQALGISLIKDTREYLPPLKIGEDGTPIVVERKLSQKKLNICGFSLKKMIMPYIFRVTYSHRIKSMVQ